MKIATILLMIMLLMSTVEASPLSKAKKTVDNINKSIKKVRGTAKKVGTAIKKVTDTAIRLDQ